MPESAAGIWKDIDERRHLPAPCNGPEAASLLATLVNRREVTIYHLAKQRHGSLLEAFATLEVLRLAGYLEITPWGKSGSDALVKITVAGAQAGADGLGEERLAGLNAAAQQVAAVPRRDTELLLRVVYEMSDQPFHTLCARLGKGPIATAAAVRVLRDAKVLTVVETTHSLRLRIPPPIRSAVKAHFDAQELSA